MIYYILDKIFEVYNRFKQFGVCLIYKNSKREKYICTDCGLINYKVNNHGITVGACSYCGHPLWNPEIKTKFK